MSGMLCFRFWNFIRIKGKTSRKMRAVKRTATSMNDLFRKLKENGQQQRYLLHPVIIDGSSVLVL